VCCKATPARLALFISLLALAALFCGLVVAAKRAPYSEEQPPLTGICPDCRGKLVLRIYDGIGAENLTDQFQGYRNHVCDLLVPWRSIWLFQGWYCESCARTWPVSPRILEQHQVEKPSAPERALFWLELWPGPSFRGREISLSLASVLCILAALSLPRRGDSKAPPARVVPVAVISGITALALTGAVLWGVDFRYLRRSWPYSGWYVLEAVELCLLAAAMGHLVVTRLGGRWSPVTAGIAVGLLASAARLLGSVIAGLATYRRSSVNLYQELLFPGIVLLYVMALSRGWSRLPPDRRRTILPWIGLGLCGALAWGAARFMPPNF